MLLLKRKQTDYVALLHCCLWCKLSFSDYDDSVWGQEAGFREDYYGEPGEEERIYDTKTEIERAVNDVDDGDKAERTDVGPACREEGTAETRSGKRIGSSSKWHGNAKCYHSLKLAIDVNTYKSDVL